MTVCIAARSFSAVFLVSDRMITSGDIQFEPPVPKITFLTPAIAVIASGDFAFYSEILKDVTKEVTERVVAEPNNWWLVKDVVDMFIKYRNVAKLKRSEAAILAPLNLDRHSWLTNQKTMDSGLIDSIAHDLVHFDLPDVDVIIAWIDKYITLSTHIYSIHNDYISCDDSIGFRAIGSGARHAESQFMFSGHTWNSGPHAAAMLAYRAKKDAEIAPGVGKGTDMFMIGPDIGQFSEVRPDVQKKFEREYHNMKKKYAKVQSELSKEVSRYVDSLPPIAGTTQANKPETTEVPDGIPSSKPP